MGKNQRGRSYGITLRAHQDDGYDNDYGYDHDYEPANMSRYEGGSMRRTEGRAFGQGGHGLSTAHRFVERTSVVRTNDPDVKLQTFAKSAYDFTGLVGAAGLAGACVYFLGDAIAIGLKLGIGAIAAFIAYKWMQSRQNRGGEG